MSLLHIPSLIFVALLGLTVLALSLFHLWRLTPERTMIGYWSVGYALGGLGLLATLFREQVAVIADYGLGAMLIVAGAGMFWIGFMRFEGGRGRYIPAAGLAGAALWIVIQVGMPGALSMPARGLLASLIMSAYCLSIAWLLWAGRAAEPLASRLPLAILFVTHGALHFIRFPVLLFVWDDMVFGAEGKAWFGLMAVEGLLHIMATSIFMIMLLKDRELRHFQIAADIDGLTGLINRAAFVRRAARQIDQDGLESQLVLFDLDHFKAINDTFGHEGGDRALVAFAHTVRRMLPEGAMLGRIGGEEFACLVKDLDLDAAYDWSERVRHAVTEIDLSHLGHRISLTVSIGLSTTRESGTGFDLLFAAADDALYRAKRAGRNCVRHFSPSSRLRHFLPDTLEAVRTG